MQEIKKAKKAPVNKTKETASKSKTSHDKEGKKKQRKRIHNLLQSPKTIPTRHPTLTKKRRDP
jgi:hypothetical protein